MLRIAPHRCPTCWLILIISLLLVGCAESTPPDEPAPLAEPTSPLQNEDEDLAAANNRFGFALLNTLQPDADNPNLFFSPLSLAIALQMTYNGASGETAEEMARVLEINQLTLDQVNAANQSLQSALRDASGIELLIGNSLWVRQGAGLEQEFLDRNQHYFEAEVAEMDFNAPEAVERINNWANEQTQGLITQILDTIPPEVILYLINAIYFKGDWEAPFDPQRTVEGPFYAADGTEIVMPMMSQEKLFPHAATEEYAVVALPYGDGRMQMVIVLPTEGVSLDNLLAGMNLEEWQHLLDSLQEKPIRLKLPRFQAEYGKELREVLQSMGMEAAFDGGRADFSGMGASGLFISRVFHKAIVKVNEEGTEAAAVTVVEMPSSVPPSFIVNRPFLFAIHDSQTDAILFLGAIYQPEPLD
ncbi:MAG: serpin family protein [Litorilinea sp.]